MIDLHCHILPGLDDGPATIDDSLAMCRMAAADGIRIIVATAHFRPGWIEPQGVRVRERLQELQTAVREKGLDLTLLPGAEVTVTAELADNLSAYDWLSINSTGRYFIAEFSQDMPPQGWNFLLSTIIRSGRVPILTHPERCTVFGDQPDLLRDFTDRGGLVQITATSLTGESGGEIRELAESLLRSGLVHIIASDGHSPRWRPPLLASAVKRAAAIVGTDRARALVTDIPRAVIEGRNVPALPQAVPAGAAKQDGWFAKMMGRR